MHRARHWLPLAGLLVLVLLQLRLLVAGRVLAGYDALTYFYPNEQFAAEALKSGSLPLWNPYLFTGVPFLANVQTAIFYPLNVLFLVAPAANAYAYAVVLHVLLGAWLGYAFGLITLRLSMPASFALGATYACGGFLMALAGHLNQLQASAWLPLVLLVAEQCYRRRSWRLACAGAVLVAAQFLAGHMQEFYISMVGAGLLLLWIIGADLIRPATASASSIAVTSAPTRRTESTSERLRGVTPLFLMFGLGAALAAVQALPTYELTGESIRSGGLGYQDAIPFSLPPWMLLRGLLPAHGDPQLISEWIGYVGVAPALLASFGLVRSPRGIKVLFFLLAVIALLLAIGQYLPVFQWAYSFVPGVKLFRVPARWLLLYSFAMAVLCAMGVDAALYEKLRRGALWRTLAVPVLVLAGVVALFVALATVFNPGQAAVSPSSTTIILWLSAALAGIVALAMALVGRSRLAAVMLSSLIAGELLVAGQGADVNQANLPEAVTSLRPAVAHLLSQPGLFRVLPFSEGAFDPGDLAQLKTMVGRVLSPNAAYDYVVATKHKETLTPNLPLQFRVASLDGYDGGVLPLRRYVAFKRLFPMVGPNRPDGRLREQLHEIPDTKLLSWLNVRFVLMDRTHDVWLDGVYYDLGLSRSLAAGDALRVAELPELEATSVGIVAHLTGAASVAQGTIVGRLEIVLDNGQSVVVPLRAGVDTAEAAYDQARVAHSIAPKALQLRDQPGSWSYKAIINLPRPSFIRSISVRAADQPGKLVLRGLSLIDERRQLSEPVVIDPALRFSHLGDVKVYENKDALQRAFLVHETISVANDEEALKAMERPDFDATRVAVVAQMPTGLPAAGAYAVQRDEVAVVEYRPEVVRVVERSAHAGLLVLTDSYYPGWRALVDGQPAEILRVNLLFRGVAVPAGEHEVTFVYEPLSLRLGAAISILAVAVMVGVLVATRRRRAGASRQSA